MRTTNRRRQLISWPAAFDIGLTKQPVGIRRCFTVKPVGNCQQALADGSPNQAVLSKPFEIIRTRTYIKASPSEMAQQVPRSQC
jgi:hypothetical protein